MAEHLSSMSRPKISRIEIGPLECGAHRAIWDKLATSLNQMYAFIRGDKSHFRRIHPPGHTPPAIMASGTNEGSFEDGSLLRHLSSRLGLVSSLYRHQALDLYLLSHHTAAYTPFVKR